MHRKLLWSILLTALLLSTSFLLVSTETANARDLPLDTNPGDECVVCHSTPGLGMQFSTGEIVSVYVSTGDWGQSVHGSLLQCTACHADMGTYPHQSREIAHPSPRDLGYLTRNYASCGNCHEQEYQQFLGSVHAQELLAGNTESAVCSDCHGNHDIEPANAKNTGLSVKTAVISCGNCHESQFQQYQNSVHGQALLVNGDPNVPTCVDCHGVHAMGTPTLPGFRRQSPSMCATCHANETLMKAYGLPSDILDTYVSDFHGTTVNLINAVSEPMNATNAPTEAMCYDCHGVHEIRSMIDSENPVTTTGLVTVCRNCHEDAPEDFPAAWLGHRKPTPDTYPLVYWIQRIYTIFIAGTLILLVGHIVLDFGKITAGKVQEQKDRRNAE